MKKLVIVLVVTSVLATGVAQGLGREESSNKELRNLFEELFKVKQEYINTNIDPVEVPKAIVPEVVEVKALSGKVIFIDAGHGITSIRKSEPVAPNSKTTKPAFVSGTSGKILTEEQLNLQVAKKLQVELQNLGASVVMARESAECNVSNVERAKWANDIKSDLTVRIHADGSTNKSVNGLSMLVPSAKSIGDADVVAKSKKAGSVVLERVIANTGAKNLGVVERSDLSGFNWSQRPVILIEMGFMTNVEEEKKLVGAEYQDKIVQGVAQGLVEYFKL